MRTSPVTSTAIAGFTCQTGWVRSHVFTRTFAEKVAARLGGATASIATVSNTIAIDATRRPPPPPRPLPPPHLHPAPSIPPAEESDSPRGRGRTGHFFFWYFRV